MIDTKANFYLVFLASFIIIVVTGINTVADIWRTLYASTPFNIIAFVIPFILAWIALLSAIFFLLQTLRPRHWRVFRPTTKATEIFFGPNPDNDKSQKELLDELAIELWSCWEIAMRVNSHKSQWLEWCVRTMFFLMASVVWIVLLYLVKKLQLF